MANSSQALNIKGIYHKMHGIAEQIRIMNELNAHLIQPFTHTPAFLEGSNRSHHSYQSGGQGTS